MRQPGVESRSLHSRVAVLLLAVCPTLFATSSLRAATLQLLSPFGSSFGQAYGVDGQNVVGIASLLHTGFLYDGHTYTEIKPPGGAETQARGISGNKIVGNYDDSNGTHAFLFDGANYTKLDDPLAVITVASGISGNKIVGWYNDASNVSHGFMFDGTTWTTLDDPLGVRGTVARGISGNNIVGTYTDAKNRTHGFLYDGTSWTTLNDPLALGGQTIANGVDGTSIVGYSGISPSHSFIYDGFTYAHPSIGVLDAFFTGISGNRIVGYYRDGPYGLNRPIIYTIHEPATWLLGTLGLLGVAWIIQRSRRGR
jgi:hypothetical protein